MTAEKRAPRLPTGPWFHIPHPVPSETPHVQPPTITEGGEHGLAPACLSSYSQSTEPGLDAQSGWRPTKAPLLLPTQWYCSSRCSTRIPSWEQLCLSHQSSHRCIPGTRTHANSSAALPPPGSLCLRSPTLHPGLTVNSPHLVRSLLQSCPLQGLSWTPNTHLPSAGSRQHPG